MEKIFLKGKWTESDAEDTFSACNPRTSEPLKTVFPVSSLNECIRAAPIRQPEIPVLPLWESLPPLEDLQLCAVMIMLKQNGCLLS